MLERGKGDNYDCTGWYNQAPGKGVAMGSRAVGVAVGCAGVAVGVGVAAQGEAVPPGTIESGFTQFVGVAAPHVPPVNVAETLRSRLATE